MVATFSPAQRQDLKHPNQRLVRVKQQLQQWQTQFMINYPHIQLLTVAQNSSGAQMANMWLETHPIDVNISLAR
jgi:hypothetical protein